MLAFAWQWNGSASNFKPQLSQRLAASLCSGIGGHAGAADIGRLHFAYRALRSSAGVSRGWRPALLPSGRIVVFHGYFDNAAAIASQLDASGADLSRLCGLAFERWGDEAGDRIIGEYCAIIAEPDTFLVRLWRSPLRAPPLYYFHNANLVAAASVPRALFAAGVEQRLNEARAADSLLINFTDHEESWFTDVSRVPTGHFVDLRHGAQRVLRKYYDLFAKPDVRLGSDDEYIEQASQLLDQGVRACLAGFSRPGATLSGGLDTPQVAVRALATLPPGQGLPTFTFHPEPAYDGRTEVGHLGDERPFVEAFAAMHPGLEPHFTANDGYGHDYRWNDFFHLMGAASSGLTNMYLFHGLFTEANKCKCDVLLLAEWGNFTFSDKGDWGYVEYFLKGNWRQLWLALTRAPHDSRPLPVRFLIRTLSAFLPLPLWRLAKQLYRKGGKTLVDLMQPLSNEYLISSGAKRRFRDSGADVERYQPRNRRQAQRLLFQYDDGEGAEIYQAFEQMYGIALRDPMAYRPFVEFCFGLPVEMFMRDGILRWMAKEMAKGIMPEEQRKNCLNGRWDADWHLRIGRRREDYLAEVERLAEDHRMAAMFDLPRLHAALEDWPKETPVDAEGCFPREFAVPRALLTAKFMQYVEGRNT